MLWMIWLRIITAIIIIQIDPVLIMFSYFIC